MTPDPTLSLLFWVTLGVRGAVALAFVILAAMVRSTGTAVAINLARVMTFGGIAVALSGVADAEMAVYGTNTIRLLALLFWVPMLWALYRLWHGVKYE